MKQTLENAAHYTWGDNENCDGWLFVDQPNLGIIYERMPPGTRERPHYHNEAMQFFYILSGSAIFELDGITHELFPREGITIDPKKVHWIMNEGIEELHFLVVSQPTTKYGDRVNVE